MSKKVLWLVVSCLLALTIVMAACGPAATPATPTAPTIPTTPTTTTTPVQEKPQQEAVKPGADTPKYGGTLNLVLTTDITTFDVFTTAFQPATTFAVTNEPLVEGDWAKGSSGGYGTKETYWGQGNNVIAYKTGQMATGW